MKCKDCLHYKVCRKWYILAGHSAKEADEIVGREITGGFCTDFSEKSMAIELPCKVGDVLFTIEYDCDSGKSYIEKVKCSSIEIDDVEISICCETIDDDYEFYVPDDFGEAVFRTREEAEKALEVEND